MKAVLISIQPKWCELIANSKKTVEVRKTEPKLETPFKVYIYCTKNKKQWLRKIDNFVCKIFITENRDVLGRTDKVKSVIGDTTTFVENGGYNGKVIGEFVCDEIKEFYPTMDLKHLTPRHINMVDESQVNMADLFKYANGKILYGWHISNLVIYDKPKLLHHFFKPCDGCDKIGTKRCTEELTDCRAKVITRPPQSWCYVESEVQEDE